VDVDERRRAGAEVTELTRRQVREQARRGRTRRGRLISGASTVVVIGLVIVATVTSSGWDEVRQLFFSWDAFRESFPDILRGFWLDVRLFVGVEAVVLVLGLAVALARSAEAPLLYPLRLLAAVYTDVFRGLPTILVVFLVGFAVPALGWGFIPDSVVILGAAALALSYGAYVAEVYRAGINSVHPSQRAAARALGLTGGQAMRFVILPQAVRRVVPPLLNDFISLQKDVALVSILGPLEAFRQAQVYASLKFNFTPLLAAAVLYLAVTVPLARIVDVLQARSERARAAGGAV
jgi:polar amino acid transport system permease protein